MLFYIDYENVHRHGLNGIERLCRQDSVRIYYSDNIRNGSRTILDIPPTKAHVIRNKLPDQIKAMNLHNALDIVILNDLYRMRDMLYGEHVYIITHDKGFDEVIETLNGMLPHKMIWRCNDIFEASQMEMPTRHQHLAKKKTAAAPAPAAPVPAPLALTKTNCTIDEGELDVLFDGQLREFVLLRERIVKAIAPAKSSNDVHRRLTIRFDGDVANRFIRAARPHLQFLSAS